jgi:hypothetical protein
MLRILTANDVHIFPALPPDTFASIAQLLDRAAYLWHS